MPHEILYGGRSRYRIVKPVGRWSANPSLQGEFYLARDEILERDVLIKTLSPAPAEQSMARALFMREAMTIARLSHPNIISILEFADHEGMPYSAFEWLEGKSLLAVMNAGVALNVGLSMIDQVLEGLLAVHEGGIVHRDIKPANIFIEHDGSVKIMNFVVAHVMAASMTGAASLVGTPSYMSPEQARGGKVDGRSDLFSVGCVLYEMVTGQRAFRGDSITAVLFKVITEQPDYGLIPRDPEWAHLRAVIVRALHKMPEHRYPDAGAMRADLELAMRELGQSADWTPPRSGSPDPGSI